MRIYDLEFDLVERPAKQASECNCYAKTPTIPVFRAPSDHLPDCPARAPQPEPTLKPMAPKDAAIVHERDEALNKALEELFAIAQRSPVLSAPGSSISMTDGDLTVSVNRASREVSKE